MNNPALVLSPKDILPAFSAARVWVSMMEGPPQHFDSREHPYKILTHTGWIEEGEQWPIIDQMDDETDADLLRRATEAYLDRLITIYAEVGGSLIEWRTWPEIMVRDKQARTYSRLSIHREPLN